MAALKDTKLGKTEKKLKKKQSRLRRTLLKHDGIEIQDKPTKILCVNNAGLDTGVTRDEVFEVFCKYGETDDIMMLPKKPYCFVCYKLVENAEEAYIHLNGYTIPATDTRKSSCTFYISFVSKVPESLSPSNKLPPGLILLPDFISEEYGQRLLDSINWKEPTFQAQQRDLKHRRVKHYGFEFKYGINNVDPDDPLPDGIPTICNDVIKQALQTGHVKFTPDQLTINQYEPGQGIPPHVDTPSAFEDGIMSLSLGSQVVMDFRHPDGQHLSVLLPPCSLLIMTGESRYVWSHGITPCKSDIIPAPGGGLTLAPRGLRTSFTFRKITRVKESRKLEERDCKQCDLENDAAAAELEKLHVHQVYDNIADHFSGTRHSPWPRIFEFLKQLPAGSLVADIGCGNGKYLGVNNQICMIGSDRSQNLVKICQERNYLAIVSDILSIPLRTESFDVAICIAVIHHLSTKDRRLRALSELLRIVRPKGKVLVYVWAMEQELHQVKSKYLKEKHFDDKTEQTLLSCDQQEVEKSAGSYNYLGEMTRLQSESEACTAFIREDKKCSATESPNIQSFHECTDTVESQNHKVFTITHGHSNKEVTESSNKATDHHIMVDHFVPSSSSIGNENACVAMEKMVSLDTKQTDLQIDLVNGCTDSQSEKDKKKWAKRLEVHVNRTQFKQQDILVPWQLKNKNQNNKDIKSENDECKDANTFHRFYHVFKRGELEALCRELEHCKVVNSYYDQGNWAVMLEKVVEI
ncbi:hypothetical protein CHS0354_037097 [Potamilus streckersoni]|uniref:tRNA (carboxymethyluridine(34)-5-O)-methyltransferase n=1 Tax=Potamilus streckersoni TaxID=2493646 RepID=A0AAE0RP77_9BIVA|nr:hypothetical protein CHS0354_037097 [Potamilus streckersoni]